MDERDFKFLRIAFEVAQRARHNGNHPFGALLVDSQGQVLLEAENTVLTSGDVSGHAEINLVRMAAPQYERSFLSACSLYASSEPCPMCAGAIFWSGIGRVVFGLDGQSLVKMLAEDASDVLALSCREVFSRGRRSVEVLGPLLEDEARLPHLGFWSDER